MLLRESVIFAVWLELGFIISCDDWLWNGCLGLVLELHLPNAVSSDYLRRNGWGSLTVLIAYPQHGSGFWQNQILKDETRGNSRQDVTFPNPCTSTYNAHASSAFLSLICPSYLCFWLSPILYSVNNNLNLMSNILSQVLSGPACCPCFGLTVFFPLSLPPTCLWRSG